jgi:hypothetical protein
MKTLLQNSSDICFAVIIFTRCEKDPDPEITISDKIFLTALIKLGVDTNGDSIISPSERDSVVL